MSRASQQWQTQRKLNEHAKGWARWDRVYQSVLSWADDQLNIKPTGDLSSHEIQEKSHAYRDVYTSVHANSGASSNDRGTAQQTATALSGPRVDLDRGQHFSG